MCNNHSDNESRLTVFMDFIDLVICRWSLAWKLVSSVSHIIVSLADIQI